jgi:hypothetical protein
MASGNHDFLIRESTHYFLGICSKNLECTIFTLLDIVDSCVDFKVVTYSCWSVGNRGQ